MDELRQQATGHEAVQRVVKRIQDKREELQDRWETSDSAVVERINALAEDLLSDSTRATAMRYVSRSLCWPMDSLALFPATAGCALAFWPRVVYSSADDVRRLMALSWLP